MPRGVRSWSFAYAVSIIASSQACRCDEGLVKLGPELVVTEPTAMDHQEWVLDFGSVILGERAEKSIVITNRGSGVAHILSSSLRAGSDPAFSLPSPPAPGTAIGPRFDVAIAVDVVPIASGPLEGHVDLTTDDRSLASLAVRLVATGTTVLIPPKPRACALDVSPARGDFGSVPLSGFQEIVFTASSTGTSACTVTDVAISGSSSFTIPNPPSTPLTLTSSMSAPIIVRYKPSGPSDESASLDFASNDPPHPNIAVPLIGRGMATPAQGCLIRFVPKPADFGAVGIDATATRRVAIWNFGVSACDIVPNHGGDDPRVLSSPGSDAFSITLARGSAAGPLAPLAKVDADVRFSPPRPGAYSALAIAEGGAGLFETITSSDTLPLLGRSGDPHVCLIPEELDFQSVLPGAHKDLTFDISACGAAELEVRGIQMAAGSSPELALGSPPILPVEIPPGLSNTVTVRFSPTSSSAARGLVQILSNDPLRRMASVRLKGNVPADCGQAVSCAPMTIGLPATVVGRSSSTRFVCTNMGARDVTVSSVHLRSGSASDWTVTTSTLPRVLHAGDALRVLVDFMPHIMGSDSAALEIDTDSCFAPVLLITMTAQGKASTDPVCTSARLFTPTTRWEWSVPATEPIYDKVSVTPVVVNLLDTNGDGFINSDDTPDVVFTSFPFPDVPMGPGILVPSILRAVSGDSGSEIWSVTELTQRVHYGTQAAAGDLDGDGVAEIVVPLAFETSATDNAGHGRFRTGHLICFDHLGRLRWISESWHRPATETDDLSGPSIADLDGDGSPEIILGASVFDARGHLLWEGERGIGSVRFGPLSVIADVDGDRHPEVVAGSTLYRSDGTLLWEYQAPPAITVDGFPIVIDTDADGHAEVVLRTALDSYVVINADGSTKYGPIHLSPTAIANQACPSPFAAGDLDGDGKPELAIPAGNTLFAIRPSGEVLWTQPIGDYGGQCGASGASVFDFDGDGRMEVVYADPLNVWIFRGLDGAILFQMPRLSETLYDYPVVADVDGDGHADLLITQWRRPGVVLLSDVAHDWAGTQPIWNEHSYHVSNAQPGGAIPANEAPVGRVFDGFRGNISYCRP
jgi:hypothetical protein